jgi:uncharacterized protein
MNDPSTNPYSAPGTLVAETPITEIVQPEGKPWGPWATLGWTVVAIVLMTVVQIAVGIPYVVGMVLLGGKIDVNTLSHDGNFISTIIIATTIAVSGLVLLLCRVRHVPIAIYLALKRPRVRQVIVWTAGLAVYIVATDLTSYALGRPIVHEFMAEVYATAWLPLLLITLLIAAPIWEETLMRGFVFTGIARSSWGVGWAIFLSSLIWSVLHIQYGWFEIAGIFVLGIFLGFARRSTGSMLLTMFLHSIANAVATLELIVSGV